MRGRKEKEGRVSKGAREGMYKLSCSHHQGYELGALCTQTSNVTITAIMKCSLSLHFNNSRQ